MAPLAELRVLGAGSASAVSALLAALEELAAGEEETLAKLAQRSLARIVPRHG